MQYFQDWSMHTHLYPRAATLCAASYEQCLHTDFIPSLWQLKPGVWVTEGRWAVPISYSSLWHQWNQQVSCLTVSLCLDKAKSQLLHRLPQWIEARKCSLCGCWRCLRTHDGSRHCFHLVPLAEAQQVLASGVLGTLILKYLKEIGKCSTGLAAFPNRLSAVRKCRGKSKCAGLALVQNLC